jgi:putative transposase
MSETQCLSERDIRIARVLRLLGTAPMTRQQAERAGQLLGLHSSTVYKLRRRFLRHPVTSAAAPIARGPKMGNKRPDSGSEQAIQEVPKEWLPRQRRLAHPLLAGLKPPGRNTVARRWAEYREAQAAALADDPSAAVAPGTFSAAAPLDIVQIDHTQTDVIVVDDWCRRPLGRPWLSVAIDLHGRALRTGCAQYGVELMYRPVGRPQFGGHVERMNRTLMERLRGLPGATGNSPKGRKARRRPEQEAALTLAEFERWLAVEVAQRYHYSEHRGLAGATPASVWQAMAQVRPPKQLPPWSRGSHAVPGAVHAHGPAHRPVLRPVALQHPLLASDLCRLARAAPQGRGALPPRRPLACLRIGRRAPAADLAVGAKGSVPPSAGRGPAAVV